MPRVIFFLQRTTETTTSVEDGIEKIIWRSVVSNYSWNPASQWATVLSVGGYGLTGMCWSRTWIDKCTASYCSPVASNNCNFQNDINKVSVLLSVQRRWVTMHQIGRFELWGHELRSWLRDRMSVSQQRSSDAHWGAHNVRFYEFLKNAVYRTEQYKWRILFKNWYWNEFDQTMLKLTGGYHDERLIRSGFELIMGSTTSKQ